MRLSIIARSRSIHPRSAFLDVLQRLAQRFIRVRGIHLVPATVTTLRRALGRFAERAVERTRELRRIGEDRSVGEACVIERTTYHADSAIHHVARSNDVGPRARVRDRLAYQEVERGVVVHLAVSQDAAVTVIRVLAHADVGDDDELRQLAFERAHRALYWSFVIPRAGAFGVLVIGNAEQQDTADANRRRRARIDEHLVHRRLMHARHGAHRLTHASSRAHEQRQHELRRCESRFAHEVAERGGASQAARTILRISRH